MKIDPFPGELTTQLVEHPFVTKTGKHGCQRNYTIVLTPEQRQWLCRYYPEVEGPVLMQLSGMSHSTLHRFAREMHLVKSAKGLRAIKRRQARHIKRLCERNGYYDSLRGRQPSEACRKATAQMWQDIRDGKREHPCRIMRRKNPRKYRQWMQRKSEERRETIRKETRRMIYGLPRQTRLRCVVMCRYTKRQVSHRYNALKRGYIILQDCSDAGGERYNIYYDAQTQRTDIFERNLIKDGFHLAPWSE